ncbi:MAG: hypothetical protein A3F26_03280 [Candidatus Ryanbacteria bacterium RIFCSPHIGHO2_12_FULL_47_12b]|uniref:Cell division protein FtsX n=1 Tax=Candidatus Ryanbacteria bacterium RIFCSPLOWO2_12_FULL_47_9c TaxID=1802131 RepID=A0A1G2H3Q3_9BACT|nr:MAG: hypothetical protein A3F26_03280 [Candidatus Ryanbacteria bacterium RIFCSPHIGHO2_12_FULL_47_12b]OGZ56608.1 MAG: hypothetical protein A3G60_03035 [Candidatus Ryanbacteria bacterium RIFCSPLOWO2_12_FULL_47_9c]
MFTVKIRRIITAALTNFWRNGWVSVATILVMVLALFMAGSLILFQVLLESTLAEVQKKIDVSVYFLPDAEESEILHVKKSLEQLSEVQGVEYVSRQRALEIFKERHADNTLISSALDELGENPLGASLKVEAKDPSYYEAIDVFLKNGNFRGIDKVNFRQHELVFKRLSDTLSATRKAGLGVSIVLGAIAFLVAFNTIRLAIYTSRDEIGIMRLVGASSWYVRGPFLIEGAVHGFLATVITTLLFWPLTLWLGPKAQTFFGGIDIFAYYAGNIIQFFLMLFLIGVTLGVLSSFVATQRYLKI